jgi:hypothetical protein
MFTFQGGNMRRLWFIVVVMLVGTAFAQQGYWGGVSLGSPALGVHFGAEDLLSDGVDVRGTLGFSYLYTSGVYLGADALFALDTTTTPTPSVEPYLGAGAFTTIGSGFGLGVTGLFGGEYRLDYAGLPEGGLFIEIGPDLYLAPTVFFGLTGRIGFNYHF